MKVKHGLHKRHKRKTTILTASQATWLHQGISLWENLGFFLPVSSQEGSTENVCAHAGYTLRSLFNIVDKGSWISSSLALLRLRLRLRCSSWIAEVLVERNWIAVVSHKTFYTFVWSQSLNKLTVFVSFIFSHLTISRVNRTSDVGQLHLTVHLISG